MDFFGWEVLKYFEGWEKRKGVMGLVFEILIVFGKYWFFRDGCWISWFLLIMVLIVEFVNFGFNECKNEGFDWRFLFVFVVE